MNTFTVGPYELPEALHFDPATHLWVSPQRTTRARCGFDPLGSETSGDIVAVSFEPVGTKLAKGDTFGHMEAAKFVGPLLAPIAGTLASHNEEVISNPALINDRPLDSWLIELDSLGLEKDLEELLSGRETVSSWFAGEIKRFEQKGMIAE